MGNGPPLIGMEASFDIRIIELQRYMSDIQELYCNENPSVGISGKSTMVYD
jgi:hypothetical protein